MKISIKTLQQQLLNYDVAESETVLDLKKRIETEHKHAVAAQKLIFSGTIIDYLGIYFKFIIKYF